MLHRFLTSSVLERYVALLPHIINFLEEIGRPVAKLETQFQIRFCVLADIFGHLNILLQGSQKQLCNLYEAVKGFDGKLSFFKVHAESGNFLHFHFTREVCGDDEARTEDAKQMFVGVLDSLQTAFNKRFDFTSIDDVCCFFTSSFTSQPDVCHKLSQTFGVDEAVLQEDFIDFKIVPGLKNSSSLQKTTLCFLGDESAGPVSSVTRGYANIPGTFCST